ncbi:uncharacterized protein LAJ45_03581 [Morchella importuna]|uniref:uncharacterized protein n=1 Tax=Morchella importuna TaxID=1174673 RepID=UPI001E8DBB35|nr:uncharacterized protein LAJ45_03581 [Morchella importuna]KAH8152155.1 hypothetical protein LAJ45_03581 [Morchella importuna]
MTSSTKDIFKHPKGSFDRLTPSNYSSWKNSMRRLLRALLAWKIVSGDEEIPPVAGPNDEEEEIERCRKRRQDFEQRREDAAAVIYNSCSSPVRIYIDEVDDPEEMWTILAERLDTACSAVGRQTIYRNFMALRPVPGAPIGDYFSRLLELRNQIAGTEEAISDIAFKTHIFSTLPTSFEVTSKIQQNRADATIENIIDALKEDESIRSMRTQPDSMTEAFYSGVNPRNKGNMRGLGQSFNAR